MKKNILTFILLLFAAPSFAQNSLKEMFDDKTRVYFYGLDFTHAHFVGSMGFKDAPSLKSYFMPEWNNLFVKEATKYSLQRALRLTSTNYITSISHHTELNKTIDVASKITDGTYAFSESDVNEALKQYQLPDKDGIGLTYIVEAFSKSEEMAIVWVTFFDLETKKILLAEKLQGKAGGGSFRNFWAGAILQINNSINFKYYKIWKSQQKL
jgi:hypothetical protein